MHLGFIKSWCAVGQCLRRTGGPPPGAVSLEDGTLGVLFAGIQMRSPGVRAMLGAGLLAAWPPVCKACRPPPLLVTFKSHKSQLSSYLHRECFLGFPSAEKVLAVREARAPPGAAVLSQLYPVPTTPLNAPTLYPSHFSAPYV